MNKKLYITTVIGIAFVSAMGILMRLSHVYTSQNALLCFFVPTNNSLFQQLKLLFFPQMLYSFIEYFFTGKRYQNYIFIKALSCILGIFLTLLLTYCSTKVFSEQILLWDAGIFFISILFSYGASYRLLSTRTFAGFDLNAYGIFAYAFTMLIFFLCTTFPPQFPTF